MVAATESGERGGCRERRRRDRSERRRAGASGRRRRRRERTDRPGAEGGDIGRTVPEGRRPINRVASAARRRGRDRSRPAGAACTIGAMTPPAGPPPIQIPRWIQLVGLPVRRVLRVGAGSVGGSHDLPVPDRGADRAPARPDRAHARGGQGSPRHRGGPRVPVVRGGDPRSSWSRSAPSSSPRRRRRPDAVQRLFHRSRTDRSAASRPTATSTACSRGSITTTCRASRSRRAATGSCSASASATSAATRTGS